MTKARSNATANAAKGDLTVGNGTNLSGVLAVGSNGDTIVADSSTATGLVWAGNYAAGKNTLINGDCVIAQRGTSSITLSTAFQFPVDRFWATGASGETAIQSSTGLTALPFSIRMQRTSGQTVTTSLTVGQTLESKTSIPLQGKSVTLSFYARAGANWSGGDITARVYTGTGTDQSGWGFNYTGTATPLNATKTLTTSWQRFSLTGTIATNATQVQVYIFGTPSGTAGAADYFDVTGVQLEPSPVMTAFQTATGNPQGELAACQRYYYRSSDSSTNFAPFVSAAISSSSTQADCYVPLPVTMRTKLASVDFANLSIFDYVAASGYAISNVVINSNSSPTMAVVSITFSTATAGRFIIVRGNNSSSAYLGFSAEL